MIRIIGNGAFGSALFKIFGQNAILENSLNNSFEPISKNDFVLLAVPSDCIKIVLNKILIFDKPKGLIIVSKGIYEAKLLLDSVKENLDIPLIYLAGPNFAKEIMHSTKFLSMTLAGPKEFTNQIKKFLPDIIIDETQDVVFPQVCAFMKNINAFVIGFLNLDQNARATLIMQGIKEARELANYLGSCEQNFMRACVSDFILTCTSLDSRNYKAGINFEKNIVQDETQESLKSIKYIYELKQDLKLPIVDFCYDLIVNDVKNTQDLLYNIINFI